MDQAVDPETLHRIGLHREGRDSAIEAHDVQTRPAGPVTFIQFHLVVPASMTVTRAHDICDRIEHALGNQFLALASQFMSSLSTRRSMRASS